MATLTVYPNAGSVSPADANQYNENATYSTAHDATDATASDTADIEFLGMNSDIGATYMIRRAVVCYDTSPLGSGATITDATLSLYYNSDKANVDSNQADQYIVSSNPSDTGAIPVSAWSTFGTTGFASIAHGTVSAAQYYDFPLNANGISNISKTSISKFGVRSKGDIDNSTPTGANRVAWKSADNAGTTTDPKLTVTYTAGGGTLLLLNVGT